MRGEGVLSVETRMSCTVCLKSSCLLQKLYVLDLHKEIVIGEELTPESLRAYLMSIYMIKSSLLPSIDEPKFMRLWEMVVSRCISNAPAIRLQSTRVDLEKMASRSPMAMAGSCSSTQRICAFWQWAAWARPRATLLCVKLLSRPFRGMNMSAAEQVLSWFRNCAKLLNETRPLRHAFKVLYFIKEHNKAIDCKRAVYLNKFQAKNKKNPSHMPAPTTQSWRRPWRRSSRRSRHQEEVDCPSQRWGETMNHLFDTQLCLSKSGCCKSICCICCIIAW